MGDTKTSKSTSEPRAWATDAPWAKEAYRSLIQQGTASGLLQAQPLSMPDEHTAWRLRRQEQEAMAPLWREAEQRMVSDLYKGGYGASPGKMLAGRMRLERTAAEQFGRSAERIALENEMQRRQVEQFRWSQVLGLMGLGKPSGQYSVSETTSPSPGWGIAGQGVGALAGLAATALTGGAAAPAVAAAGALGGGGTSGYNPNAGGGGFRWPGPISGTW